MQCKIKDELKLFEKNMKKICVDEIVINNRILL